MISVADRRRVSPEKWYMEKRSGCTKYFVSNPAILGQAVGYDVCVSFEGGLSSIIDSSVSD